MVVTVAGWMAWPSHEAFLVYRNIGPGVLIHVDRKTLAERLLLGETLEEIVGNETAEGVVINATTAYRKPSFKSGFYLSARRRRQRHRRTST